MADPIKNPFDKDAIDKLEEAVDLSRVLVDNANELNRIYKKAGTNIQDSFVKSTRSLAKTLNDMSTQVGKMSLSEFKRSDAAKLQKKLAEDITKLEQEKARIEQGTLPLRQRQADVAKQLKINAEANYRTARATYGADSVQAALAKRRLDVVTNTNNKAKESLRIEEDAVRTAGELIKAAQEENDKVEQYVKNWDKANLKLGLAGRVLKGMGKIPIVGDIMNANKGLEAMQKAALQGKSAFKVMGEGISAAFEGIEKSTIILAVIGAIVKAFKLLKDLAFSVDEDFTNIAKSTGILKEDAFAYYDIISKTADTSKSLYMTTRNQVAALGELNDAFGTTLFLSGKMLEDQVVMTKEMGLTADEASSLQGMAAQNAESADDFTTAALEGTAALYKQKGILLDGKKVLQDVSKVNGQIAAFYKNNPKLIGDAVVKVKALGLSLEQAKNQASQMLNFEDSIQSQMEAEVLTGKALNLDRARLLSLQGDIAGAAEETLKNIGGFAEYSNMNAIQQEAIAKAIGMSADELSNSLMTQEKLKNLSIEDRKSLNEQVQLLMDQGKVEEANALKKRALDAKSIQAVIRQQTASAQFEATMDRVKDIFAKQIAPILEKVMQSLTENLPTIIEFAKSFASLIGGAMEFFLRPLILVRNIFKSVSQMINGDLTGGLKNLGLSILKFVLAPFKMVASVVDAILGTNIAKVLSVGPKFEEKKKEEAAGEGSANSSAANTLNTKDFTIKSLPEDTITVQGGTKLGRTDEMVTELKKQNQLLAALLGKDQTISIDGQKIANVVAKNVPTTYGNLLNPASSTYG
jgi:hypothetical protein